MGPTGDRGGGVVADGVVRASVKRRVCRSGIIIKSKGGKAMSVTEFAMVSYGPPIVLVWGFLSWLHTPRGRRWNKGESVEEEKKGEVGVEIGNDCPYTIGGYIYGLYIITYFISSRKINNLFYQQTNFLG
jgi:hypothetical protein